MILFIRIFHVQDANIPCNKVSFLTEDGVVAALVGVLVRLQSKRCTTVYCYSYNKLHEEGKGGSEDDRPDKSCC